MSQGWIVLHRQIQEHWLWEDKPFSKAQAWVDLLLMANHKDNKFMFGGELVEVKQGEFITSERKLSERWGWSRKKVDTFLSLLQSEQMLVLKKNHQRTTINIVNYSDFQDVGIKKEPPKSHRRTTEEPPKNINNNDNNDNNENNIKYIVDYLNQKAGTCYKASSKKTQTLIKARMKEGFTLDNFKAVIDKKAAEWKGTDMEQYLRPETLFGTKFEGYLNANIVKSKPKVTNKFNDFPQRDIDFDSLEQRLLARE